MAVQNTKLYGGGLSADIPTGFIDASEFREVPDTQEVFVHQTVDDSIVIDLLECVEEDGDDAVNIHLKEIAELNNAEAHEYSRLYTEQTTLNQIDQTPPPFAIITIAIEPARKWGRSAHLDGSHEPDSQVLESPLLVTVLAVVRLQDVCTDLLASYNVPITLRQDYDGVVSGNPESMPGRVQNALESIRTIVKSMKIHDWQLFG